MIVTTKKGAFLMKNAAKGNVMYGAKLFLLTLILTMMSFVTASAKDKMTGTGNFYYQRNGSEVVISNSGKIASEKGGTIFVACYDGEVLDCVKMIKADEMISEFYVREFTMKLSDGVENLKVKAFAWDSASAMTPLCDAKDITETPGDVLRAEGRVVSTYKTDMALSSNRARIEIRNSEYPNGYVYIANISLTSDIDERIFELLDIDYIVDEEGTMVVLGYSQSSKNNCIQSNANLYAGVEADYWTYPPTYNDTASSPRLNIYKSETANNITAYKLATDVSLLGNGVQCAVLDMNGDAIVTKAEMDSFSQACDLFIAGDFSVIDTPLMGETVADKKYDFIKAEFYGTAVVQSVMDKADGTKRIAFEYYSSDINRAYLDIDAENSDVVYKIKDTDGNSMKVDDIKVNDVFSIKYQAGNYSYSSFYEIIVSRNTVEGYVSGTYAQNGRQYYTVGDKNYRITDNIYPDPISVGSAYKLYLDKDGNIAKTEVSSNVEGEDVKTESSANVVDLERKMVVSISDVEQVIDDGAVKNRIKFHTGTASNTEEAILITEDSTVGATLQIGDAFVYVLNEDNEALEIIKIFSVEDNKSNMLVSTGEVTPYGYMDAEGSKFYMYPVVDKYYGSIALATDIDASYQSRDTGVTQTYAAEPIIYAYDNDQKIKVSLATPSEVVESYISTSGKLNNGLIIDWTSSYNWPAYAVYRMVDGDIYELYSIYVG